MLDKILLFIPFFSRDIDLYETEKKKYYLQSLILFIMLLLIGADYLFSIEKNVRMIVSENSIAHVINALEIIFCCLIVLLVLTVFLVIVSNILYVILDVVRESKSCSDDKTSRVEYIHRISLGSKHRFQDTVDWLIIVIIILYKWDHRFIVDITNQVPEFIRIFLFVYIGLYALTSTIWGIINRFFCLWSDVNTNTNGDMKLVLKDLLLENERLKRELQKYKSK